MRRPTDSATSSCVSLSRQPKCGLDDEACDGCTDEDVEPTVQGESVARGIYTGTGVTFHRSKDWRKEMTDWKGDVIFFACTIARYYGYKPSDILKANYDKLESRMARGTQRGSGDSR